MSCCLGCTSRVLNCHRSCLDYREYKKNIAARNKFLGRTESEQFLIESTVGKMVARLIKDKNKRIMKVDRSGR